jgi:hypothetical protein
MPLSRWRLRRRAAIRVGVAMLLLSAAMVLGQAAPAQAYTCSRWYHVRVDSGVSVLDFNFSPQCSDGLSHINGTLYDTACDARQAQGFIAVEGLLVPGGYGSQWNVQAHVDNGCGTSNTISRSGPIPGQWPYQGWRVHSFTYAKNRWGSSSLAHNYLYP